MKTFAEYKIETMDKIDYDQIDAEIRNTIRGINKLPFIYTNFCCAGFGVISNKINEDRYGKYHIDKEDMPYLAVVYDKNNDLWQKFHSKISMNMPFGNIDCSRDDHRDVDYVSFNYTFVQAFRSRLYGFNGLSLKDNKRNAWIEVDKMVKEFDPTHILTDYEINLERINPIGIINEYKEQIYYANGYRHRIGAPAFISKYVEGWYKNDKLHRENGPAVTFHLSKNDKYEYWLNGRRVK